MFDDPLAKSVERLLRTIPETWTCRQGTARTDADEQAADALVAAGLVERRFGIRIQIGDAARSLEIVATGELGLALALQQAEGFLFPIWYKQSRTLFGFRRRGVHIEAVPTDPDDWRLTHLGALARADLDQEGRSEGEWVYRGCRQRTLLFVLRRKWFSDRPSVHGSGNAKLRSESANDGERSWVRRLLFWLVCTFRRRLVKDIRQGVATELDAAFARHGLKPRSAGPNTAASDCESDGVPPHISRNQMFVLRIMAEHDAAELLTIEQILEAMPLESRLSTRTVQQAVSDLMEMGLAQRPRGSRGGVRLTTQGRLTNKRARDRKAHMNS